MNNEKPEEVRETLERVMREKGYLNNPVTLKTDIGDFTWYVDNDSPFAKKREYNVQPEQTNWYDNFANSVKNGWQKVKDGANIAADTVRYTGESLGELAADTKIAYDYYKRMNDVGDILKGRFGENVGAADGTDNYYHPLLQCELAKISPDSLNWGLRLGYGKETWDYHRKKGTMPMSEISADSQKDLRNNLYGINLGYSYPDKSCEELLDDRRTANMRKLNIR